MVTNYPINPRVRAIGKARLDFASHTKNQIEWEKQWKSPSNQFPFDWGESWKQCVEYRVDDFPAEVGFYIDILGFSVNALDPTYAMFTSPQAEFFISIVPTQPNEQSTSPDAIRLQFMVKDIARTTQALQQRGISFDHTPQPLHPGSTLQISTFRTPHGISIELWGRDEILQISELATSTTNIATKPGNGDDPEDEDEEELDEDTDIGEEDGAAGDDLDDEEDVDTGFGGEDDENDDEEDLDSGEELDEEVDIPEPEKEGDDEDSDEDDLDEDEFESDWDDDDDDDDEDDFGNDQDLKTLEYTASHEVASFSHTLPREVNPAPPSKGFMDPAEQGPEYIELDIT
jgi:hypothetical protein